MVLMGVLMYLYLTAVLPKYIFNIPTYVSGTFLIGNNDSYGQMFVTLGDGIFDPSKVDDYCAQLVEIVLFNRTHSNCVCFED